MKQLNGEPVVRVSFVIDFEFDMQEVDSILVLPSQQQLDRFAEIVTRKHPLPENCTYNLDKLKGATGTVLMQYRERQLRALPAPRTEEQPIEDHADQSAVLCGDN